MPKRRTIQHFMHIHQLTEYNGVGDYICDGCQTYGDGKAFRCEKCNFDLHECCATCTGNLPSFVHSNHVLNLVVHNRNKPSTHVCDMCDELVEGMYYTCKPCNFNVHPVCCTKMPHSLKHVLHQAHHLELRRGVDSTCRVCNGTCRSWRYRCEMCRFDIHIECILTTVCNETSSSREVVKKRESGVALLRQMVQQRRLGTAHVPQNGAGPVVPQQNLAPVRTKRSIGRKMFVIATRLAIGVVCNVLFGTPFDFLLRS